MTHPQPQPERRYYTLEEARQLLPRLRTMLGALQDDKLQLDATVEALGRLTPAMRGNGHAVDARHYEERIEELLAAIRERVSRITELGIELKDIENGLVDFPSLRDGRAVYLCWRFDEPDIGYWHELDTGFAGRRPLDSESENG